MIRLVFKRKCKDKETGTSYEPGDVVDFANERAEEILAARDGIYADVAADPLATPDPNNGEGNPTTAELNENIGTVPGPDDGEAEKVKKPFWPTGQ